MFARQVTAGPQSRRNGLNLLLVGGFGDQHHEGGQIFVEAPQAITHPRPDARTSRHLIARLHGANGRLVVDGLGVHGTDEAQVIGHLARPGQHLGVHPEAIGAHLAEAELRWRDGESGLTGGHGGQSLAVAHRLRQVLVVPLLHLGLVVPEVRLGRPTHHVQVDDVLGLGRKLRRPEIGTRTHVGQTTSGRPTEQRGQRRVTHEVLAAAEEVSAVLERSEFLEEVHRRKVSRGYLLRTASRLKS